MNRENRSGIAMLGHLKSRLKSVDKKRVMRHRLTRTLVTRQHHRHLHHILHITMRENMSSRRTLNLENVTTPYIMLFGRPTRVLTPRKTIRQTSMLSLVRGTTNLFRRRLSIKTMLTRSINRMTTNIIRPIPLRIRLINRRLTIRHTRNTRNINKGRSTINSIRNRRNLQPIGREHTRGNSNILTRKRNITLLRLSTLVSIRVRTRLPRRRRYLLIKSRFRLKVTRRSLLSTNNIVQLRVISRRMIRLTTVRRVHRVFRGLTTNEPIRHIGRRHLFVRRTMNIMTCTPKGKGTIFGRNRAVIINARPMRIIHCFARTVRLVLPPSQPRTFAG